jgi:hypothetical protein
LNFLVFAELGNVAGHGLHIISQTGNLARGFEPGEFVTYKEEVEVLIRCEVSFETNSPASFHI